MAELLHLNLHRDYFDAIATGPKRTEYRDQSAYWRKRLENRKYDAIVFHNGYATNAPEMLVEFVGLRRCSRGRDAQYAIRLGRVLKINRWKRCKTASSEK